MIECFVGLLLGLQELHGKTSYKIELRLIISGKQLFRSLRAHQRSSDQMKILKDQSAQTATRVGAVVYRLWLPFSINRVLNLTKLRSVICMSVIYIYISIIYIYMYMYYIYTG